MPGLILLVRQVGVILLLTAACGYAAQRLRQPRVIGEIAGGLLLGPLFLGHWFPATAAALFPSGRLQALEVVSSIGLVLFLFLTGAELDIATVRRNRGATLAITVGNIGLPFLLGATFAPLLWRRFSMTHVSPAGFLLFTGIAMSITALPVLARIIEERKRTCPLEAHTATTALVCAAANDLLAWSLLALALALTHSHQAGHSLAMTAGRLLVLVGYLAVMLLVVRPVTKRLLIFSRRQPRIWLWLPCVTALAFISARITEALGVHAFFGAFLAGVCIPITQRRGAALEESFQRTLRPVVRYTLPVFFAMTGLRMQAGSFDQYSLRWLGFVLAIAVFGKICGGAIPARISGMSWKAAAQIGILMNTRGLVELIALNVGLKEGVLSPALFTVFVLMAVVTTAMTVPLLDASEWMARRRRPGAAYASPSQRS